MAIALSAQSLNAGFVIQNTAYSDDWQSVYHGFAVNESFESTSLAAGLSITLDGGAFAAPQTYGALPGLFDPTLVSIPQSGGPFLENVWDGQYMVTNFGHDASRAPGQNWVNDWKPASTDLASRLTFSFATGATAIGIGLSNFQPQDPSQANIPNHYLYINGVAQALELETLAGPSWINGAYVRNGYVTITATGGEVIHSIGFEGITFLDGMNFDALGYNPVAAVPEPASLTLFGLGMLGLAFRRRSRREAGRDDPFRNSPEIISVFPGNGD